MFAVFSVAADSNDDGERLIAPMPLDWALVADTHSTDLHVLEYAPLATSPRAGDERIVIESSRATAATDPSAFAQLIARDAKRRCSSLRATELSKHAENGYPTSVWLLDCPLGPRLGLPLQMLKVVRGDIWNYVIARTSVRADTSANAVDAERTRVADWAQHMRQINVCHILRPDHPCPSNAESIATPAAEATPATAAPAPR